LGNPICAALDDPSVVEIMLNPDGKLFIERLGHGITPAGDMQPGSAEIVIGSVAHVLDSEVDDAHPIVYVTKKVMTANQAEIIRSAVKSRLNIVVSGGTGSGKTTLANAIISEIVEHAPEDRLVILEDTAEIRCSAANSVALHTSDKIDMARLLKSTMRLRPDRIIVGEVRDGAALTLLKAWNTGHPGGLCTIHSNTARSALQRLEQLTAEASQQPMQGVIGDAVDFVISIERTSRGRRVSAILHVTKFAGGQYQTESHGEVAKNAA